MELIIKFSETLLILQSSIIRGCIFQLKVCSILKCDTGVTIHWHVRGIYKDTHEPETKALLLSSGRDISWEAMWSDLKSHFHSFVVTPGMGKITRMYIVEGKQERKIVFCLGEKKIVAVVSRFLLTYWYIFCILENSWLYCDVLSPSPPQDVCIAFFIRFEKWYPQGCNPHWKQVMYTALLFMVHKHIHIHVYGKRKIQSRAFQN